MYPYPDNAERVGYDDGMPRQSLKELRGLYNRMKSRYGDRDQRMQAVLAVRQGRMRDVFPDLFPEGPFDRGIVANMVDVAARDLAEVLAPLPSFNCASSKMVSDTAREFAEKRTRIVNGYLSFSDVQRQMYNAADRYFTYGFVPAMVEVDADERMPRITFMDSIGAYPVFDRWRRISGAFFAFYKTRDELLAMYPDAASKLGMPTSGSELVEVVRYHDRFVDTLFVPHKDGLVLDSTRNPVGECLVEWVMRPGVDDDMHGQFDDVLAVQVAKARFALLSLEAAQKAVQAPIVLPRMRRNSRWGRIRCCAPRTVRRSAASRSKYPAVRSRSRASWMRNYAKAPAIRTPATAASTHPLSPVAVCKLSCPVSIRRFVPVKRCSRKV